jgi:putative SOS response-associated peptidase YedK
MLEENWRKALDVQEACMKKKMKPTPLSLSVAEKDLLKPFDARLMRVYPMSSTVNSVKNDGPGCGEEPGAVQNDPAQSSLF